MGIDILLSLSIRGGYRQQQWGDQFDRFKCGLRLGNRLSTVAWTLPLTRALRLAPGPVSGADTPTFLAAFSTVFHACNCCALKRLISSITLYFFVISLLDQTNQLMERDALADPFFGAIQRAHGLIVQ